MNPNADHERPEPPQPVERPKAEKKKRFHIEKVEERIGPRRGGQQQRDRHRG
jgi:hypothetical protein